jgi:hypothetical protein
MEMVTLKNGAQEDANLVAVVMVSLRNLFKDLPGMLEIVELYRLCQDSNYKPKVSLDRLKRLNLLEENGQPHDSIKNVVLSAISGEGLGMTLGSPYA